MELKIKDDCNKREKVQIDQVEGTYLVLQVR